jgi:hypothetical protein
MQHLYAQISLLGDCLYQGFWHIIIGGLAIVSQGDFQSELIAWARHSIPFMRLQSQSTSKDVISILDLCNS